MGGLRRLKEKGWEAEGGRAVWTGVPETFLHLQLNFSAFRFSFILLHVYIDILCCSLDVYIYFVSIK